MKKSKWIALLAPLFFIFSAMSASIVEAKEPRCFEVLRQAVAQSEGIRFVNYDTELPSVIEIAIDAFQEDPFFIWMSPKPEKRKEFIAGLVWHAWFKGKILIDNDSPDSPRGFALWMRSKDASPSPIDMLYSGQLAYTLTTSPFKTFELLQLDNYLLKTRRRVAGDDSVYLNLIGVDRRFRNQGVGTRLIQPVLNAAKAGGVPVVLEIQKEENRGYYARFGFQEAARGSGPQNAPLSSTLVWRAE